jgi:hypothetical protein
MSDEFIEPVREWRSQWLLLAIAAAGDGGLTPVQLQKAPFLVGKNCPNEVGHDFYEFEPWDYGPFDVDVYQDAQELETSGFVTIAPDPGKRWRRYIITAKGRTAAQMLKSRLPAIAVDYTQTVVDWVRTLTFSELIRAIFKAYPEMAKNAVFQT